MSLGIFTATLVREFAAHGMPWAVCTSASAQDELRNQGLGLLLNDEAHAHLCLSRHRYKGRHLSISQLEAQGCGKHLITTA